MTKAKIFMDSFMEKLNEDGFGKDNQPNNGPELTEEFVSKQVESYTNLIKSDIFKIATK
jgi:hypothetical protein